MEDLPLMCTRGGKGMPQMRPAPPQRTEEEFSLSHG